MLHHFRSANEFNFAGRAVSNNIDASTFGFVKHLAWETLATAFREDGFNFLHISYCFGLR
jgi:hypothetical protein